VTDVWEVGDAYEPYVGRWSRPVATAFVRWLADVGEGVRWLDVGCGTGAVTATVLAEAAPAAVAGLDPSPAFVRYAARRVADPRAAFLVGDATALPLRDGAAGVVVSGLVLNFVPDPPRALAEMVRVSSGTVGVYVWDYAEGMGMMRAFWDAAVALDPGAAALDEGLRFPLCRPEPLAAAFLAAGLSSVDTTPIEVPMRFRDFDDFWQPFLGGQGPAPAYAMSLREERRAALRERLRAELPYDPDGGISLTGRAWAARGTV
jgi:SAM-dependent methyltransferase